ncbi:helix-turn-helix domain-containing protein [Phenylobacterium sp. J426]|uniref:helix-turn-helix domain-containing protein n=1 Tax=Phenylobacterium sp. J426 TaxID=2898439 RepID=UPI0021518C87|nr:helix-turn-helix domain-containing protein [Phenylobacterium sp. J426]MCR5874089.1 helix-turn-helix domain-containing protein [Phenylobacterium sp. J426]
MRASGVLGRSQGLSRLFEYLAQQAVAGRPVREADIAVEVFGRAVDLAGDASVRVYVHRLRKKLDDFYADSSPRLSLPLGEYRLALIEAPEPRAVAREERPWRWAVAAALLLVTMAVLGGAWLARATAPARELDRIAAAPLWAGVGQDRPLLVVVGDYYIFGDTEQGDGPKRMIRAFDINSAADLDSLLMARPELQGRYVDLDTYYTPVGATLALREIMPLARRLAAGGDRVGLVTSSQLTPQMLKGSDVIYVGYLSALRLLHDPVFERSRFEVGETYDELVDRRTRETFVSGAGTAHAGRPNVDYGYIASFTAPGGERIVIVAGARDIGVMQAAEIAADPKRLRARTPGPEGALYRVEGLGRTNLSATPVIPGS